MKKPWTDRFSDFMAGKGFYIVLFLCVAAIGISGYYLFSTLGGGRPGRPGGRNRSGHRHPQSQPLPFSNGGCGEADYSGYSLAHTYALIRPRPQRRPLRPPQAL